MSPREQAALGVPAAVGRAESALPAPLVTLRARPARRRCWWAPWRSREERVEVFRLEQAYVYRGDGFSLHIPAGFEFDASVPRALWAVIAPLDLGAVAPLVHDFLYQCGGRPPIGAVAPWDRTFTRFETDRLFLQIMEAEGVEEWKRIDAFRAVRECGASSWRAA